MISTYPKAKLLPHIMIFSLAVCAMAFSDIKPIWIAIDAFPAGKVLLVLSQLFFTFHLLIFIWRIVLCLQYKETPPCADRDLPTCTVIVPAYNEGRQVFDTIDSIARSNYPPEKISIIGIDDGSRDDTWYWLTVAAKKFPGRVRLFRQPENSGKRHALHRGFKEGKGDIYITIDSDSTVSPHTIRHLVSPFVRNPRVGAVAGNVRVLNRNDGMIPKMLEISFAYSFDFFRAGQSVINSVMCTPGALSAYRRDVVLKVLSKWLNQTFCGRTANIGEDRAMTNLILKSGFYVHYQRKAVVHTNCPVSFPQLWKMFLRWARSNIRETWVISRFAFGRFRQGGATGLRLNVLASCVNLSFGQIIRFLVMALLLYAPSVVGPKILLGTAIASCAPGIFYALRYDRNHSLWAIPYSFFWISCLSWIGLYALMTPHKNGWMTRELRAADTFHQTAADRKTAFGPTHRYREIA